MYKVCSQCKKHKELDDFHKLQKGLYGRHSMCKLCRKNARILQSRQKVIKTNIYLVCSDCNIQKHCSDFYINRSSNCGYQSYCKTCQTLKISKSMSKLENYAKIILKKFIKKNKKKIVNITTQNIIDAYHRQFGLCAITKHKMTHDTDVHQRTDNIWNMSIYVDTKLTKITGKDFKLVIHFVYTAQNLYKLDIKQTFNLYKNLVEDTNSED
jgi:hypothetical protein